MVKDSFSLLLWHRFDSWLRKFCIPQVQPKKKKKVAQMLGIVVVITQMF